MFQNPYLAMAKFMGMGSLAFDEDGQLAKPSAARPERGKAEKQPKVADPVKKASTRKRTMRTPKRGNGKGGNEGSEKNEKSGKRH